jgi:hypothetical protein
VNSYLLYIETPRLNTNRHVHAHNCLHCAGFEPVTSCVVSEYTHHYAKSVMMISYWKYHKTLTLHNLYLISSRSCSNLVASLKLHTAHHQLLNFFFSRSVFMFQIENSLNILMSHFHFQSAISKTLIMEKHTYVPLTLFPRRGSRGISYIPPRRPR